MSNKVKVTIEMPDGTKAAHMGLEIPETIFAPTIGSLVGEVIERNPNSRDKMMRAYNLHEVSRILEAKSRALSGTATKEEKEDALEGAIKNLFEALRR